MKKSRDPRSPLPLGGGGFFSRLRHRRQKSNASTATSENSSPVTNIPSSSASSPPPYPLPPPLSPSSPGTPSTGQNPQVHETPTVVINTVPSPAPPVVAPSPARSSRPRSGEYDISNDLWNSAYQNLKNGQETAKLVDAYEKILTSIHKNGAGGEIEILRLTEDADNVLDCDAQERIVFMRDMVRVSLQKAKRHENVHQAIQQVAEFVQMTSTAVNSMLSAYPPASIAWSGICAVLPLIAAPSTQSLAMSDGLLYVMEKMEWYMALSEVSMKGGIASADRGMLSLREFAKLKTVVLFQTLLEYEIKVVCSLYGASPLARALRAILTIDDWSSRLEEAKKLEREIAGYLSQFGSAKALDALEQIRQSTSSLSVVRRELKMMREQGDEEKQKAEDARRLELVGRFSTLTTCPYLERMMSVPKRVEGTCEWFQTHSKYRDWMESADGGLLLLSADPGCGKSVLSRFLLEEVLPVKMPKDIICYFFFKDSPDQNNTSAALCALIHQILTSNPGLTSLVQADIISTGTALTVKERVLWKIFEKIVMGVRRMGTNIVCVFDALDECQKEGRLAVVEHVRAEIERNSNTVPRPNDPPLGKIRFLITTRGYPEIITLFQDFSRGCILLAGENKSEVNQIQKEIALVASHKLDKLAAARGFSDKRKGEIHNILVQKGGQQRTYLWVRLVFEVLESNLQDRLAVWQSIVNTLPQTVYDAYDKLLDRVQDNDRARVMTLLRLMIAAFRPLPIRTAILLLDARDFIDDELANDDDDPDWEPEHSFKAWVLGTCGIFVTIYDHQLFFIHQTAKEYLQVSNKPQGTLPAPPHLHNSPSFNFTFRHSISPTDAHKTMAENCIALWKIGSSNSKIKWELEASTRHDSGYRYCIELWAQHFREAQLFSRSPHEEYTLASDISPTLYPTYLSLWRDTSFIRAQHLSGFLARYDRDTYAADFSDVVRLAFIATYGHYRLLESELRRLTREEGGQVTPDMMPFILGEEGAWRECAGLLLRWLPVRPVIVVSDDGVGVEGGRGRGVAIGG